VPNTRIRFKAAAIGGLAAGTGWHLAGWAFARLVAGSTQYAAIYSSFAILVVFIIWLYVIWLVLLLGVDICYYVQNRACSRDSASYRSPGWRMLRHTGLTVAYLIGDRFRQGGPPWTVADLASRLELPQAAIESVLERLRDRRILLAIDLDETAYLPARGLDTILVADILAALGGDANGTRRLACSISAVDALVARLEEARERALQELSWQALLEAPSEATTQQQ
jgi:membrane protein